MPNHAGVLQSRFFPAKLEAEGDDAIFNTLLGQDRSRTGNRTEKFVNELLPEGAPQRGGGGAIDFVRHVTGFNFVQAVKICLDALNEKGHQ